METLLAKRIKDDVTRIFTKAFMWAGISFLLVCVIGFITNMIVDQQGVLKAELAQFATTGHFNADFYGQASAAAKKLQLVSFVAIGLILVSAVLRFIWWFRFATAGKTFILSTYTIYVLAQGLGFGMLFTLYQATELLVVFGVAGAMFGLMAFAGWKAKDIAKLGVFLVFASIGLFFMGLVAMILYFTGVYSDTFIFIYFLLGGVLTLLWIVWDVGALKRFATQQALMNVTDEMAEYRLVTFFGFRFLSDLINLIWTLLRLMRYFRN